MVWWILVFPKTKAGAVLALMFASLWFGAAGFAFFIHFFRLRWSWDYNTFYFGAALSCAGFYYIIQFFWVWYHVKKEESKERKYVKTNKLVYIKEKEPEIRKYPKPKKIEIMKKCECCDREYDRFWDDRCPYCGYS